MSSKKMEVRKIQISGTSTYTISLPKKWIEKLMLKRGDLIQLIEQDDARTTVSSGTNILWNNQGSGDYLSNWIKLPTGHYVFTFITLGGALEAKVTTRARGSS